MKRPGSGTTPRLRAGGAAASASSPPSSGLSSEKKGSTKRSKNNPIVISSTMVQLFPVFLAAAILLITGTTFYLVVPAAFPLGEPRVAHTGGGVPPPPGSSGGRRASSSSSSSSSSYYGKYGKYGWTNSATGRKPGDEPRPRLPSEIAEDPEDKYGYASALEFPEFYAPKTKFSRRKFLSYTPSRWEILWLTKMDEWEANRTICEQILSEEQRPYLEEFLRATCTFRPKKSDWCLVDSADGPRQTHWINLKTYELQKERPKDVPEPTASDLADQRAFLPWIVNSSVIRTEIDNTGLPGEPKPALEQNEAGQPEVFSKFVFVDELANEKRIEYIEPLVSHLRHPLAKCVLGDSLYDSPLVSSRSYIVPPPKLPPNFVAHYYDAGASTWTGGAGLGGPSMSYFVDVWKRYDINFTKIEGWEGRGSEEAFMKTVPDEYKGRVTYHQRWITSDPKKHSEVTPFVPHVIEENTAKAAKERITQAQKMGEPCEVYNLFKLDIDAGDVERGNVDYILDQANGVQVDELLWEHHVDGNYLMLPNWKKTAARGVTLDDSMRVFLALRRRGIRAHSWV